METTSFGVSYTTSSKWYETIVETADLLNDDCIIGSCYLLQYGSLATEVFLKAELVLETAYAMLRDRGINVR